MDLLFILKKIVANWLMPLPLLLLLIGLGVIWLWRGQQRRGLLAVSCGWLLLLLLSAPPLADHLLQIGATAHINQQIKQANTQFRQLNQAFAPGWHTVCRSAATIERVSGRAVENRA